MLIKLLLKYHRLIKKFLRVCRPLKWTSHAPILVLLNPTKKKLRHTTITFCELVSGFIAWIKIFFKIILYALNWRIYLCTASSDKPRRGN